ncbi:MAG: transposase [Janthinobacterium lividum]
MRVEVLSGVERRRRWSDDEKARIIEETLVPGARVAEVARRQAVSASLVFGWRRLPRDGSAHHAGSGAELGGASSAPTKRTWFDTGRRSYSNPGTAGIR